MKFPLLLLCIILSLSIVLGGCRTATDIPESSSNQQEQIPEDSGNNTPVPPENNTPVPPENNDSLPSPPPAAPKISPNVVGIYIPATDGTRNRVRITGFSSVRTPKKDIDCFEILASQEELCTGNSFAGIWNAAWAQHKDTEGTKIGFIIEFSLSGGKKIHAQILKPSDAFGFYEYLEVYMYDDIHQGGGWYTHLDDKDITEKTTISSIKLTSGSKISEVGDISLTAFFYQGSDCFNEHGDYIGEVLETIVISAT